VQIVSVRQTGQLEQLSLGVLTILLAVILEKTKGFLSWLLSLIMFMIHVIFGLIFLVFGFLPSLLNVPRVLIDVPCVFAFVFGSMGLFYLFTSENFNEYLGTETIFPVIKRRIVEQQVETVWK